MSDDNQYSAPKSTLEVNDGVVVEELSPLGWFMKVLKHYATFQGRARRKEYWMFTLIYVVSYIIAMIVSALLPFFIVIYFIFVLGIILPSIAVSVRRLHDTGRTGWWFLIQLIPLIGFIIFIIFAVQDSEPGTNHYGSNPKGL